MGGNHAQMESPEDYFRLTLNGLRFLQFGNNNV